MLNDTGSNVFSLTYTEAQALGYNPNTSPTSQTQLSTAGGLIRRETIVVLLQVIAYDGAPLTGWFREVAILNNPVFAGQQHLTRYSGRNVRSELFFATAPGDPFLHVSRTKTGLISLLSNIR